MEITVDQLYEFKSCPLRYRLKYLERSPKIPLSENDGLREAVMATISYYYMCRKEGKVASFESLKQKFSSLWYGDKVLDIVHDSNQSQRRKELEAVHMLSTFYRKQQYSPDEIVAVNTEFRIPFGKDLFVTGNIPLIRKTELGYEVVNFKASQQRQDEFWNRTDMNLTFQALGFHSLYKKEADTLCIEYLRLGQRVHTSRRQKDYERLYKQINFFKEHINKGYFYPRESYACDKCPAKLYCAEW